MFDFKTLVSSLLTKNTPSSSVAQSATMLVRDLPEAEYFSAVVEIVKAVAKINADTDLPLKERLKTLLYVDERAHGIHDRLCREYLRNEANTRGFLPTILAYWHELANAYQICLRVHAGAPSGGLDEDIRLATVRGVHHQMRLISWNALRYLRADGSTWQQAYRFYLHAEEAGFARGPVRLYQDSSDEVTAENLLLHGCMLHLANPDNFSQREIVAVDKLLRLLVPTLHLEHQPLAGDTVFAVNLATPDEPQLMRRSMVGKGCRYWLADPLTSRLADLMFDLDLRIPSALAGLGLDLERKEWSVLCEKLSARWSQDGGKSLRRAERSLQSGQVRVCVGFDRIAFLVKVQNGQDNSASTEEWRISDVSATGMGLAYLGKSVEHLSIGKLLLIAQEGSAPLLGVIRRISRQQSDGTKVGVELLGQHPVAVSLSEPGQPDATPASALYITQPNSRQGQRWFLVPTLMFAAGRELILTAQGKSYRIRLKAPHSEFIECIQSDFDTLAKVD